MHLAANFPDFPPKQAKLTEFFPKFSTQGNAFLAFLILCLEDTPSPVAQWLRKDNRERSVTNTHGKMPLENFMTTDKRANFDLSVDLQIRNGNPQICRGEQCSPENKGLLFVLDGRSMIAPTVFAEFPSFSAQT